MKRNNKKSLKGRIFLASSLVSACGIILATLLVCTVLSDSYETFFANIVNALPVLVLVGVSLAVCFTLASRISEKAGDQLKRIETDSIDRSDIYEEYIPIKRNLNEMKMRYDNRIEELDLAHKRQDTMRREFTANVSHELKTPLTSISGYAEIIKNGIAKEEDVPRFAGKICDESGRLITLVGDIIKLSQLDDKEVDVKTENIDLYELTSAVLGHLEMAAKKRNVTLTLSGDHNVINSAEQIVEEIIFNVCDNAVKYNKEGGRVDVTIKQFVDGVEVAVSDTGIGIAEEDIGRIFERFYRVDKSHSKEIGGTGLGLSIVKHGAMYVGARVNVESKLGEGTTVRILF